MISLYDIHNTINKIKWVSVSRKAYKNLNYPKLLDVKNIFGTIKASVSNI